MRDAPGKAATLEPVVSKLERFVLYQTTSHLYVTASDKLETQYRVLKIDRRVTHPAFLADICQEDPVVYTPLDMIDMLDMIHEGNRAGGGLCLIAKGWGIVGFAKFLDCYYLNFITQRRLVSRDGDNLPSVEMQLHRTSLRIAIVHLTQCLMRRKIHYSSYIL